MSSPFHSVRSDHTGALRTPDWLRDLYVEHHAGNVDAAELRTGQVRAVGEVLRRQEQIGLPVVTDGELLRFAGFQQSFGGAVEGFDALPYVPRRRAASSSNSGGQQQTAIASPHRVESGVSGPGTAIYNRLPVKHRLKLVRNLLAEEYALSSSLATHPVKLTLIGPDRISQRFEYESSRDVYADMDAFLADVIDIERQMIAEVVAAGCRYIQIDEPGYTAYVDPPLVERMHARGEDPRENMQRSIRADNAVIADFPDVTFAVHICRGNGGGRGGPGWHGKAATTRSPNNCSASSASTDSCSSMTARPPGRSKRCVSCRPTRSPSWVWSAITVRSRRPSTSSSDWTRPRATCGWSNWRSARGAASARR